MKTVLIISLLFYYNLVLAACDVETDPFCSGDVDAPIDDQLIFMLLCALIVGYCKIKKIKYTKNL